MQTGRHAKGLILWMRHSRQVWADFLQFKLNPYFYFKTVTVRFKFRNNISQEHSMPGNDSLAQCFSYLPDLGDLIKNLTTFVPCKLMGLLFPKMAWESICWTRT